MGKQQQHDPHDVDYEERQRRIELHAAALYPRWAELTVRKEPRDNVGEVVCEDGRRWPTVAECARALRVTRQSAARALRENRPLKGLAIRIEKFPTSPAEG